MAFSRPLQVEQCDVEERLLNSIVGMSNTEKSELIGCLIAKWVFSAWLQVKFLSTKMHLHISNALTKFHTAITLLTDLVSIIKYHKTFLHQKQEKNSFRSKAKVKSVERELNLCRLIVEEIPEMLLWRMCGVKGIMEQQREPRLALRCRYIKLIGRPFKRYRPIHNKKLRMYLYISLCEPICNFLKKKKLLFFHFDSRHGIEGECVGDVSNKRIITNLSKFHSTAKNILNLKLYLFVC